MNPLDWLKEEQTRKWILAIACSFGLFAFVQYFVKPQGVWDSCLKIAGISLIFYLVFIMKTDDWLQDHEIETLILKEFKAGRYDSTTGWDTIQRLGHCVRLPTTGNPTIWFGDFKKIFNGKPIYEVIGFNLQHKKKVYTYPGTWELFMASEDYQEASTKFGIVPKTKKTTKMSPEAYEKLASSTITTEE